MLTRVPFAPGERYQMMWGCCAGTHKSSVWQNNGNDYYAGAGTACVSPVAGVVVRAGVPGIGQGMRVGIQGDNGYAVYMAHMHRLRVGEGQRVTPGQPVGEIWPFPGMPDHLHFSVAKGSYASGNFVDPWDEVARLGIHVSGRTYQAPGKDIPKTTPGTATSRYFVEELPMPDGMGPRVFGPWANTAAHRTYRDKTVESMKAKGRVVAPMQAKDGSLYIYEYPAGRYGKPFRWGPWSSPDASKEAAATLKADGRAPNPRRFAGAANSLYPWT